MPGTAQDIVNAVQTAMDADTTAGGVNTLDGGRHYEHECPQDAALPHVIYDLVTSERFGTFGADSVVGEMQVDVYADYASGAAVCRTLANAVVTLLHKSALTVSNFSRLQFLASDYGTLTREVDANRIMLRFKVWAS